MIAWPGVTEDGSEIDPVLGPGPGARIFQPSGSSLYPLQDTRGTSMRRCDLYMSDDLHLELACMARETGITIPDLIRRGLAVMKAQRGQGKPAHLGFVSDPEKLDVELINVL